MSNVLEDVLKFGKCFNMVNLKICSKEFLINTLFFEIILAVSP
ncbi:hypothetical protein G436_4654 [Leptospira interrogans serovar Hardjo str. Norma]|uniref:Uncharacterized protein n=1 Tax=Leptospira interrogans serovar Hardjo str. Norma TaxID=1279460 RepID=A0A0M4N9H5_LEPIR|nr:hypothetical protein G436_4654 [Leptospira interrogans serovar Hardjo str. Norma]